jgi:hypothetical protein
MFFSPAFSKGSFSTVDAGTASPGGAPLGVGALLDPQPQANPAKNRKSQPISLSFDFENTDTVTYQIFIPWDVVHGSFPQAADPFKAW